MNRLTLILVLTLTVLLGSSGVCWGAYWEKAVDAYKRGDYATALKEWTLLAEQGNADAQYLLGGVYFIGEGVPQDYKTAVKWTTLAAERGIASAQGNLGVMYAFGEGIPKDYVYAYMWGHIAAMNGSELGGKLRDDFEKQMTLADISAAQKLARECVSKNYKGC